MAQLIDLVRLLAANGLADATRAQLLPPPFNVVAKTAATYQILPTDKCGTLFTNRGASALVAFTLPSVANVPIGTWYEFLGISATGFSIASIAVDTLGVINDVAADTITVNTTSQMIGAHAKVINDGTQWVFVGDTVGVTYTAAS